MRCYAEVHTAAAAELELRGLELIAGADPRHAARAADAARRAGDTAPRRAVLAVGCGRSVGSEREAPNMLVDLV